MSADNTIMILECKNEWRVEHLQATDNRFWNFDEETKEWKNTGEINNFIIYHWFKSSLKFDSHEKAVKYAIALNNSIGYVEYGIQYIDDWKDREFPEKSPNCCKNPTLYLSEDYYACDNCGEIWGD